MKEGLSGADMIGMLLMFSILLANIVITSKKLDKLLARPVYTNITQKVECDKMHVQPFNFPAPSQVQPMPYYPSTGYWYVVTNYCVNTNIAYSQVLMEAR